MIILDWLSHGIWNLSILQIIAYTLIATHITIVAVTVYLHRHSAHRAVDLHPVLKHFFRFWLWSTTSMNTKHWTAVHRKHHVFTETEQDPHSPQVMGLSTIMLRGAEAYEDAGTPETLEKYGAGTPDDWMERHVYTPFKYHGVGLMLIVDVALFGVLGLTVWAVQMMWIPVLAAGVINGVCHYFGYRNFECPDAATNIVPWGILIGGEELHNNHHTYPNSAKLSVKPWEFDIGWFWIRLFQICGMANPRSTGPVVKRDPHKSTIDMDTAWALLNDRFRVMSRYADQVVSPLVEHEWNRADAATRRLLRRAKTTLCREESLLDEAGRKRISALVEASPNLKSIYEFRLGLQNVWAKRGGSSDELLGALKNWCLEAEASGISALREFVKELRSYTMPASKNAETA